jgi:predicted membrane GTPase involved in stress response
VVVEVDDDFTGPVIAKLSERKGLMTGSNAQKSASYTLELTCDNSAESMLSDAHAHVM